MEPIGESQLLIFFDTSYNLKLRSATQQLAASIPGGHSHWILLHRLKQMSVSYSGYA